MNVTTKITIPPTITGAASSAWLLDLTEVRKTSEVAQGKKDAALAMWLIEAPWAHPAWHSYSLVLVHLRPMGDGRETKMYLPGATHEVWLMAMHPECDRQAYVQGQAKMFDGTEKNIYLNPTNFAAQFIADSDETAMKRVRGAVERVCDGSLNPDTDYIRHWMYLFGDNMIKDKARAGQTRIITPGGEFIIPAAKGPQDLN